MIHINEANFRIILGGYLQYLALHSYEIEEWSHYYDALDDYYCTKLETDEVPDWNKLITTKMKELEEKGILIKD